MNKREQAMVEGLRLDLARARAFRLTERVDPDVLPPPMGSPFGTLTRGWLYIVGSSGIRVEKACSSAIFHGWGWEKTTTQQPRALYSTEERALRAARWHIEQGFLSAAAELDARIAAAAATTAKPGEDYVDADRHTPSTSRSVTR